MLIVIMQMLGALTSWIGTIAGLTGGMALILSQLPLLFGLVTIIALPKIVKVMLGGGNLFMAQMNVAKGVALLAAAAATGGIAAVGLGGAAAAGAAAKGAGAAASAAGGAGGGGAPPVMGGGGAAPSGPKERALVGAARSVGRVLGVTDRKSAGKAALWGAIGGAPGLAVFAARSALKQRQQRKQANAQ
jgi:type IV secretory pathway VirB6-like protein